MREKALPFDRAKHVYYTRSAKKVRSSALGSAKIAVGICDPILIFARYAVVPLILCL